MAIFRGTGGSGSSSDSTIVDAVTAQATIATTKADEAEGFRDEAEGFKNTASSAATTATNKATEANASATSAASDATAASNHETMAGVFRQAAQDQANIALGHANTANSSAVQTVAGSNTQVVGVYNNIANVNTVAGVNTDVTTVAGISSDVTTVAADASDIGTVSTNIANVNNVGNNIANVNAVHGNASNINTVAADGTDIGTVATNIANVNTVAGISSTVTTVAGLESKMDTVIADASDIGAVAGNIGDVTTVAGINADVDTVAGIAAKVTTVADNISDVQNADTNATNAATSASNASASATSASNSATTATTKATEAFNSATAASNSATTATTKASQAAGSATTAGTSASTATTKASEASSSATTATTKAGEAASSASAASGSASTATTKASEASASAASAATSATNSSNAASTWNNFYNSYLGVADAQPSVDVLGNAIVAGALYYDTGAGSNTVGLYVYNGSSWVYSTNYNNVTAPYILAQDLNANGNDIISAGKVGIGTTSPHALLHVDGGDVKISSDSATSNGDGKPTIFFSESGADEVFAQISYHGDDQSGINNFIGIGCNGSSGTSRALMKENHQMVVTAGGNVGIGTSSPSAKLTSSGVTGTTLIQAVGADSNGFADVEIKSTGTSGASRLYFSDTAAQSGSIKYSHNDNSMQFSTAATERLRIDASGNVGIGTSSPAKKLTVYESTASTASSLFHNNQGTVELRLAPSAYPNDIGSTARWSAIQAINGGSGNPTSLAFLTNGVSADPAERMRIDSSGNVGIGTSSPSQKLHVDSGEALIKSAYSTSGTTNSKIYFASRDNGDWRNTSIGNISDALTFATGGTGTTHTNGTERMRITSTGNVGIGTTTPDSLLEVVGADPILTVRDTETGLASTNATLRLAESGGGDALGNYWDINYTANNTLRVLSNTSERLRIDSSGRVLVGTASVGYAGVDLTVGDTADSQNGLAIQTSTTGNGYLLFGDGSGAAAYRGQINYKHGDDYMAFHTANAERMRIDSSGNLLVGKSSANSLSEGFEARASGLTLMTKDGGSAANFKRKTSDGNIVVFEKDQTTVGSIGTASGDLNINGGANHSGIRFQATGLYPLENGTVSSGEIDLGAEGSKFKNLYLSGGVRGNNLTLSGDGSSEHARIDTSGNLLVGTTDNNVSNNTGTANSGINLLATGQIFAAYGGNTANFNRLGSDGGIVNFDKDGTTVGSISVTSSATAYNTSSDERLKENITDSDDAGSKIDAIQVRQFDWKADGSHQDYGVVAQELLEVAPEAVSEGETEDDMMSVDYSKLVPTLIKEIQTLRNRVAQLENN